MLRLRNISVIIILMCLTSCGFYEARLNLIDGWPCKNYNGFNSPEQACRSINVRTTP